MVRGADGLGTDYAVPVLPLCASVHRFVSFDVPNWLQEADRSRNITAAKLLKLPLASLPTPSSLAFAQTSAAWALGLVIWTILEYTLHRFLFHVDYYLPDTNWAMFAHFLLHGIHHFLPMDRLRLVMPPLLFFALETPFTNLAHAIFPKALANGGISGAFSMYIVYDCMHYALHHTRLPQYMAEMKRYHLAHHYKSECSVLAWVYCCGMEDTADGLDFELGFGVTSKIWDIVFNTVLPVPNK